MHTHTHACTHARTHAHTHTHMHTCTHARTHTHTRTRTHTQVITKIQPYIDNEDFTPAAIQKVSKACTSICAWVRAMDKYHFVARAVAPKRVRYVCISVLVTICRPFRVYTLHICYAYKKQYIHESSMVLVFPHSIPT